MNCSYYCRPGNTAVKVVLESGESLTAEAGAMLALGGAISVSTSSRARGQGGLLAGVKRMLARESFFLNTFAATGAGEVWLAPTLPGDVLEIDLAPMPLIVQGGSFLACGPGAELDLHWHGLKSLLSGEHMFWLRLSGRGLALLSSFGAVFSRAVDGELLVDTGHIVAFSESLDFRISKAGDSWVHSFLGGEGLVCRFRGCGTVWCQSHNDRGFGQALGPMLKPRSN